MVACGLATWAAVMHRSPEDLALHCPFLHHHPLCIERQLCIQDVGALRHRDRGRQVVACQQARDDAGSVPVSARGSDSQLKRGLYADNPEEGDRTRGCRQRSESTRRDRLSQNPLPTSLYVRLMVRIAIFANLLIIALVNSFASKPFTSRSSPASYLCATRGREGLTRALREDPPAPSRFRSGPTDHFCADVKIFDLFGQPSPSIGLSSLL